VLTMAVYRSWLSPIHFLHTLKQKVADMIDRRRRDGQMQALERLLSAWEDDIREFIASADPGDIGALSVQLGRQNLIYCKHLFPLVMGLLAGLGETDEQDEQVGATATRGWEAIAHRLEELLPHLPPAARRDVRAAALIMADVLRVVPEGELSSVEVDGALARGVHEVSDEEARFFGLTQILGVVGTEPDHPAALAEAAALALWQLVREGASEELAEDAYLSAEAAEAAFAHEQEGGAVSLEDFLRAYGS
jgi:hypothetical protein